MNDIFKGMGVEVTLTKPDSFNIVRESLTRIGVAAKNEQILYQSAHILHKQGRYAIVHFKELFSLDGKPSTITENDYARRNTVANLLQQWELVKIVSTEESRPTLIIPPAPLSQIKIITFSEKTKYQLISKYQIGGKSKNGNNIESSSNRK